MKASHPGPPSTKPNTVRVAQALIWIEFTAIVGLYTIGLNFLLAATTAAASDETTIEVLLSGGAERWVLVLTSIAVTGSLPLIAVQLGRRREAAIKAAWYALAFVPFCMYVWVATRAYMATFPDGPEFFISAGAMLLVCGSMPTAILLLLATPSSRAWFASAHLAEELDALESEADAELETTATH
ncbi:hypothetical protein L0U85_18850 [Glycomyces sp. L485]|uniref:hypothetical protein n=1 Tax=Glycomyces sp. L485 TaxID=2909235 RepID=UPI001F4AB3EB|nr:hypothetical protein [Glycomyces sp. L485]MCH7232896.1 hypothetical protein [Glycomyces sp. L485]